MTLSNTVTEILPNPDKKGFVDIFSEDGLMLTLSEDALFEAGLRRGDIIDEARLMEIEYTVCLTKAKAKAYNYLSYGDMSAHTLLQKLMRCGFSEQVAGGAVCELEKAGYIDDERYGCALAAYCANSKLYGPRRIEQELMAKGISKELAGLALESLETDFENNIITLVEGKFACDKKDRKQVAKLISALLRYGYDYELITGALSDCEEQYE